MHRHIFTVALSVSAVTICLMAAPASAAGDDECGVILPAADRLETAFNQVSPSGTPPWIAAQIRSPLSLLHNLRSAAGIDLRIRSNMLASQIDDSDPYRPANPAQLASDLGKARELLAAAREYCAP
jgi:hypothetical protein